MSEAKLHAYGGRDIKGKQQNHFMSRQTGAAHTPKTETIHPRVQGTVLDKHKTMLFLTKPHTNLTQQVRERERKSQQSCLGKVDKRLTVIQAGKDFK